MVTCEGLGKRLRDIEVSVGGLASPAADGSRVIVQNLLCDSSAVIGSLVVEDKITPRKLNVVQTNSISEIPYGVLGIIYSKSSPTVCSVLLLGVASGYSGLQMGGPVFVDTNGGLTNQPPVTGMIHRIGMAVSATELIFNPTSPYRRAN